MNNIVLDVAIGLTFIFLLYSLLATTINEFVAMIFAYRHRMLEKAIEQMLDGKNYSYYWWDKVGNFFLWLFQNAYHWVKSFTSNSVNISADDKADNQVNVQETKTDGKKQSLLGVERKDYFKTCNINEEQTQKNKPKLKRIKLNKKAAFFAANITNHPLYRRKSEQSILYKKPAYLSASAFSDILFDVLSNRRSEINATPVLMNDIKTFVSNQLQNNPGLKSILNMYIEQANGDVQKFKLLLEDWFDDSMDRVSGWYKRQATKVLFIIGLILAMAFNVSTIDIVDKLSVNKDLRETMAKSASAYVENANKNQNVSNTPPGNNQEKPQTKEAKTAKDSAQRNIDTIHRQTANQTIVTHTDTKEARTAKDSTQRNIDTIHRQTANQTIVTHTDTTDKAFANEQQQIKNIQKLYKDTIAEINMMMGLGWDFSKANTTQERCLIPHCMEKEYNKTLYVLSETMKHPRNWLGFLITALAITLGAPFWFDLLNKFINIRAGGNEPSEDATNNNDSNVSKNGTLNQKPAPNSFA